MAGNLARSAVIPEPARTAAAGTRRLFLASSNPGKLRDFAAMPAVRISLLPGFAALTPVVEDGATFLANAVKKAEEYGRAAAARGLGEWVLADDSGLEVAALGGAPGVHSARFARLAGRAGDAPPAPGVPASQKDDAANNALLLERLAERPEAERAAAFVCVLALARRGRVVATFTGRAEGFILAAPRGHAGFGYDPLFYSPAAGRGFAELTAAEKARYSHRGAAARRLADWLAQHVPEHAPEAPRRD